MKLKLAGIRFFWIFYKISNFKHTIQATYFKPKLNNKDLFYFGMVEVYRETYISRLYLSYIALIKRHQTTQVHKSRSFFLLNSKSVQPKSFDTLIKS